MLYAQEVVAKFGMGEAKAASTPFEHGGELVLAGAGVEGNPAMAGIPYRSAVGSLMYLVVCTRPDLAMVVSALSSPVGALGGCEKGVAVREGDSLGGAGVQSWGGPGSLGVNIHTLLSLVFLTLDRP